jgi:hypothetical protein
VTTLLFALLLTPASALGQSGAGTWDEPFLIDALPFAHQDDTTTGVEMVDVYGCADWLDESGPEVVYQLRVDRPGRLTAWVVGDVDGEVDIDVQILDSVDLVSGSAGGLDRGNRVAEAEVTTGTAWIAVDTFVDQGEPLPGPYIIRADLSTEEHGTLVRERQVAQGVLWRQEIHDDLFGGVQSVNLLEVDLTHPEVVVAPRLSEGGCERIGDMAERVEAVAAVNAGFFGPGCAPVGLVRIDDRFLASNPSDRPPRTALGLGDEGLALVEHVAPGDAFETVHQALGGLPQLVRDGVADVTWREEVAGESFTTSRHPRTAACVTGDHYLLFVTIDGRTEAGLGVDLFDLADFMVSLGCDRGLNYDGGGSTTMWIWPWVASGAVSYPSDNTRADHMGERAVSNGWMIWAPPANRPPRFTTEPLLTGVEGEGYRYDADALDLDLERMIFNLEVGPAGMVVDEVSGLVVWTPTYRQGGPQEVILGVSDLSETTEQEFEVTVTVPDGDGDGLPDTWESAQGTDPTRPDAEADPDGDGRSNAQEYADGTDPNDPDESFADTDAGADAEPGLPDSDASDASGDGDTLAAFSDGPGCDCRAAGPVRAPLGWVIW